MDICVDFDGTCVTHDFPIIGKDIGSVSVLKSLVENGHKIILFTMRSDNPDHEKPEYRYTLTEAVNWFKEKDIPLHGINTNPEQHIWTSSPKAYGQLYIDDAALGIPLLQDEDYGKRPFVNWVMVHAMLKIKGIIK
jgi:hypothetical protein